MYLKWERGFTALLCGSIPRKAAGIPCWAVSAELFGRAQAGTVSDFLHSSYQTLSNQLHNAKGRTRPGPWLTVSFRLQLVELHFCPGPQPFSYCSEFKKDVFSTGNRVLKALSCLTTDSQITLNLPWMAFCIPQAVSSWLINSLIPTLQQIPESLSQLKTRDELHLHPCPEHSPHLGSRCWGGHLRGHPYLA